MKIAELIKQPEGRRLEFKAKMPAVADIAKTIVAFANDAGGELFIGIRNEPRELVGVKEDSLIKLEEQISNIIHDHCWPVIIPDISFHTIEDDHLIRIQIYRGSNLPYFLKEKGKTKGTYIRVGSTNRLADAEIIAELERVKRNISFDSEPVHDIIFSDLNIEPFKLFFKEKTGDDLNLSTLKKLDLLKEHQGSRLAVNALVLFSDGRVREQMFPYAKIECARFKGTTSHEFIDQKTIAENISLQPEAAYEFVLRHINKGAVVKGVYTESRWEYPVVAIREVIRNAVVHRDYSLSGKDIKVAVYDDMVEITSPGKLMPSIDFDEMEARQSDIRNKVIAPVFKRLGIIDQWGNGLKLISDELKDYPEIEFRWHETGLQFQVQFVKKGIQQQESQQELQQELDAIWHQVGTKLGLSWDQAGTKLGPGWDQVEKILAFCETPQSSIGIMNIAGWKHRTKFRLKYIIPLVEEGILAMTDPEDPTSPKQRYYLTEKGIRFLEEMKKFLD
jgi:ATP-dependent DNA helicase RecG